MKTPIQILLDHFIDAWSSPSDLWKPSKVIAKIETMLEKEKEIIINASNNGCRSRGCYIDKTRDGERYYNETFNTNKKSSYIDRNLEK